MAQYVNGLCPGPFQPHTSDVLERNYVTLDNGGDVDSARQRACGYCGRVESQNVDPDCRSVPYDSVRVDAPRFVNGEAVMVGVIVRQHMYDRQCATEFHRMQADKTGALRECFAEWLDNSGTETGLY